METTLTSKNPKKTGELVVQSMPAEAGFTITGRILGADQRLLPVTQIRVEFTAENGVAVTVNEPLGGPVKFSHEFRVDPAKAVGSPKRHMHHGYCHDCSIHGFGEEFYSQHENKGCNVEEIDEATSIYQ